MTRRKSGRKPLAAQSPKNALQRFTWLVRTTRVYSGLAQLRNASAFAHEVGRHTGAGESAQTVNRLERGVLSWSIPRLIGFEAALGLHENELVDMYIYSSRLDGTSPDWGGTRAMGLLQAKDLLLDIARGNRVQPIEFLKVAKFVGPTYLESARWREVLCSTAMNMFGDAFESEERILREALVLLGEPVVPYIREAVKVDPLRHFNAVEALGFMQGPDSLQLLLEVASSEQTGITAQVSLEAMRRRIAIEPALARQVPNEVREFALNALSDHKHPFTSREESLGLLRVIGSPIPPRVSRLLRELGSDLRQLRIEPTEFRRDELVNWLISESQRELGRIAESAEMPKVPDGMQVMLREAIFGEERVSRLGVGAMISLSPVLSAVTPALANAVVQTGNVEYGTARSIVRAISKARDAAVISELRKLNFGVIHDEGLLLSVAWALGMGLEDEDAFALDAIDRKGGQVTRQVVGLSRQRRNFKSA